MLSGAHLTQSALPSDRPTFSQLSPIFSQLFTDLLLFQEVAKVCRLFPPLFFPFIAVFSHHHQGFALASRPLV